MNAWTADNGLPGNKIDGATSTQRTIPNVALQTGGRLTLTGRPDGGEPAPFDYIEVTPAPDNEIRRTP